MAQTNGEYTGSMSGENGYAHKAALCREQACVESGYAQIDVHMQWAAVCRKRALSANFAGPPQTVETGGSREFTIYRLWLTVCAALLAKPAPKAPLRPAQACWAALGAMSWRCQRGLPLRHDLPVAHYLLFRSSQLSLMAPAWLCPGSPARPRRCPQRPAAAQLAGAG